MSPILSSNLEKQLQDFANTTIPNIGNEIREIAAIIIRDSIMTKVSILNQIGCQTVYFMAILLQEKLAGACHQLVSQF